MGIKNRADAFVGTWPLAQDLEAGLWYCQVTLWASFEIVSTMVSMIARLLSRLSRYLASEPVRQDAEGY